MIVWRFMEHEINVYIIGFWIQYFLLWVGHTQSVEDFKIEADLPVERQNFLRSLICGSSVSLTLPRIFSLLTLTILYLTASIINFINSSISGSGSGSGFDSLSLSLSFYYYFFLWKILHWYSFLTIKIRFIYYFNEFYLETLSQNCHYLMSDGWKLFQSPLILVMFHCDLQL